MTPRRWMLLLAGIAVAMTVGAVVAWWPAESGLARVDALLSDEGNFTTGVEAGTTMARIGGILQAEGERCDAVEVRCGAILSAAGYAQVMAARVLLCTAPGRREARDSVRQVVAAVEGLRGGDDVPEPPPLPQCG